MTYDEWKTRAPEPEEPPRERWRCEECGESYTAAGAERALRDGCAAGCSGIDIYPEEDR